MTAHGADWERLPVTDASARGIARLAKDAEDGHPVVITRHGRPVAAIVPLTALPGTALAAPRGRSAADAPTRPARSATERWVQALATGSRRVPGPPATG